MIFIGMSYFGSEDCILSPTSELGNISSISISNAKVDSLYVDKSTNLTEDSVPNWYSTTVLYAQFNDNLYAGNTDITLGNVDSLRVKRRVVGTYDWITMFEKTVTSVDDMTISYKDITPMATIEYGYATIPVKNGIEGEYIEETITCSFDGLFLVSPDKIYSTNINVGSTGDIDYQRNSKSSMIEVDDKYPYVINNSDLNYDSGSISATFVEVNNLTCEINWENGWKFRKGFLDFLIDHTQKILKNGYGDARLISTNIGNSISNSGNGHRLNVITSFNWVETGNVNSSTDLYNAGFIDVNVEGS